MSRVSSFGGMIPARDDHLLPEGNAALAQNLWVYSGALEPMRQPSLVHTLVNTGAQKVFRLPKSYLDRSHIPNSDWMEFNDPDTDILQSPIANDAYARFYWTSPSVVPTYNTKARILAGNPAYTLGIPAPTAAPTLVASGGVSATTVTRTYVITNVTSFGEEGPISLPSTALTGKVDDTWAVTLPAYTPPSTIPVTKRRIYRTITSTIGVATYFFVAELAVATNTYNDTLTDAVVSSQGQLTSTDYTGPPALEGWVQLPNGIMAGWLANEIWFSEPYLPHAWPAKYQISVDFEIVGLGVIGQTLIVCTTSTPYAVTGTTPDSMSQAKIGTYEPCMSRGSIVSSPDGVFYASPNGLVLASSGQVRCITQGLVSKDRWLNLVYVSRLRAARLGTAYYTFGSGAFGGVFDINAYDHGAFVQEDLTGTRNGALIELSQSNVAWINLKNANAAQNVFADVWSGEVFVIRSGGVYLVDTVAGTHDSFIWRSKIFQSDKPCNFGAIQVLFTTYSDTPAQNPVRNTSQPQTLASNQYGIVRFYAEDQLVLTRELRTSGEVLRGPAGFKATFWQIEIEARVKVYQVQFSGSPWKLNSE